MGGGGLNLPPPLIFICENNRKSNKIMHCVDFFSSSFQDMGIFAIIYLPTYPPISSKLQLKKRSA